MATCANTINSTKVTLVVIIAVILSLFLGISLLKYLNLRRLPLLVNWKKAYINMEDCETVLRKVSDIRTSIRIVFTYAATGMVSLKM